MGAWSDPQACRGQDPYLQWARETAFEGYGAVHGRVDQAVLPLLVELAAGHDAASLAHDTLLAIPGIYHAAGASGLSFCTGTVSGGALDQLDKTPALKRAQLSLPVAAGAVDTTVPLPVEGDPARLVIGVIDRGCAFLNGALRRQWSGPGRGQTRIRCFWDQGRAAGGQPWQRPDGFGYGRELDAAAIDGLIARVEAGATEAEVYRAFGHLVDERGRLPRQVHGAHVVDSAGGLVPQRPLHGSAKPPLADAASGADLIFVGVPEMGPADTTGANGDVFVLDAIHYILHRAGSGTRVVINLSIGAQAGPHDGSSCIERAMDELITQRRDLAIVVAAGNGRSTGSASRNGRWQANGVLMPYGPDAVGAFVWRTLGHDVTDSFLECWLAPVDSSFGPSAIDVCITAPDGTPSGWIALGGEVQWRGSAGVGARLACHPAGSSALGDGILVHLALAPSAGARQAAPAGRWKVALRNRSSHPVEFDAWVQRDEPPAGLDEVLQSALEEVADAGAVAIDRGCTLSSLGGARHPLVVGASRLADDSPAPYSAGAGPAPTQRARRDADLLAPADQSALCHGLWASGVATGSVFRMSGTSVSAPVLARVLANWLMRQPPGMPGPELRRRFLEALRALPVNAPPRGGKPAPKTPRCGVGSRL